MLSPPFQTRLSSQSIRIYHLKSMLICQTHPPWGGSRGTSGEGSCYVIVVMIPRAWPSPRRGLKFEFLRLLNVSDTQVTVRFGSD
jgi:hypothetical protein